MLLLEQDNTKMGHANKNAMELDAGNDSGEYKVEIIWNSAVYVRKSANHQPGLYYLVF